MAEQRLFISHASEDAAVADKIVAYLEARGVPCWISSRDIPPRAIYADAIVEGMQACSACAVIVSAAANTSKAVKRELELASHEDKPFIPIRIDAAEPAAGMGYYLRNTQWVDYGRDGERALDRIVPHLTPDVERPPTLSQLVGTSWWGTYSTGVQLSWRLNAGGDACWGTTPGDSPNCGFKWSLETDRLTIIGPRSSGGLGVQVGVIKNGVCTGESLYTGETFELVQDAPQAP